MPPKKRAIRVYNEQPFKQSKLIGRETKEYHPHLVVWVKSKAQFQSGKAHELATVEETKIDSLDCIRLNLPSKTSAGKL